MMMEAVEEMEAVSTTMTTTTTTSINNHDDDEDRAQELNTESPFVVIQVDDGEDVAGGQSDHDEEQEALPSMPNEGGEPTTSDELSGLGYWEVRRVLNNFQHRNGRSNRSNGTVEVTEAEEGQNEMNDSDADTFDRDVEAGLERLEELEEEEDSGVGVNDDDFDNLTVIGLAQRQQTWQQRLIKWLRFLARLFIFPALVLTSVAIPILLVMLCFALMVVAVLVLLFVYYCCSPRGRRSTVPFHVLVRQILEAVEDEANGLDHPNTTPKYTREEIQNAMVRRTLIQYECHDEHGNLIKNDVEPTDEATREERMHQDMFPVEPDPSSMTAQAAIPEPDETMQETDCKSTGLFARRKQRRLQKQKKKEAEAAVNSKNSSYDVRLAPRQITFRTDPPRSHSTLYTHRRTYVFSEPLKPISEDSAPRTLTVSDDDTNDMQGFWARPVGASPVLHLPELSNREPPESQNSVNNENDDDSSSSERYYFPMPLFTSDDSSSSSSSLETFSASSSASVPSVHVSASEDSFLIDNDSNQRQHRGGYGTDNSIVCQDDDSSDDVAYKSLANESTTNDQNRDQTVSDTKGNDVNLDVETGLIEQSIDYFEEPERELSMSISLSKDRRKIAPYSVAPMADDIDDYRIEGKDEVHSDSKFSARAELSSRKKHELPPEGEQENTDGLEHGGAQSRDKHISPTLIATTAKPFDIEEAKTEVSDTALGEISLHSNIIPNLPAKLPDDSATTAKDCSNVAPNAKLQHEASKATTESSPDVRGISTYCNICLLEYEIGDIVVWSRRPQGCHHAWHEECLLDWLKRKPTCPNCRQEFFSVEDSPQLLVSSGAEAITTPEAPQNPTNSEYARQAYSF